MEERENDEKINDLYSVILDSPLMDEIWSFLGATDKYEILTKAGWDLKKEYADIMRKNSEALALTFGNISDAKNMDSNADRED